MLESFFKIVLADAPVDVIELINNLVVETYERMGITENTDCSAFPCGLLSAVFGLARNVAE